MWEYGKQQEIDSAQGKSISFKQQDRDHQATDPESTWSSLASGALNGYQDVM